MKRVIAALLIFGALCIYGCELIDLGRFYQGIENQVATAAERGQKAHDLAAACTVCHGYAGVSHSSFYPSLAGLSADYSAAQLRAFASNERQNAIMGPLAKSLSTTEIELLADYYAARPAMQRSNGDSPGEQVSHPLLSSCLGCHSDGDTAPLLLGQGYKYLVRQLRHFRSRQRVDPGGAMNAVAAILSDADIDQLALLLSKSGLQYID